MDRNSPDFYVEQTDESLEETVKFVDQVINLCTIFNSSLTRLLLFKL